MYKESIVTQDSGSWPEMLHDATRQWPNQQKNGCKIRIIIIIIIFPLY